MFDKLKGLNTQKLKWLQVPWIKKKWNSVWDVPLTKKQQDSRNLIVHDLINPYKIIFNPSYLELNDSQMIDYLVLNDMSGDKKANYLHPILKYPKNSVVSLFFSPINTDQFIDKYKKEISKLESKIYKDRENGKEEDKTMVKMVIEYREMIEDFENKKDTLLNYSILYSQKLNLLDLNWQEIVEPRETFLLERQQLKKHFQNGSTNLSTSKYYTPVAQIEEAFLSQQPLAEYRLKDWSNITAQNGMTLYPFFTVSKETTVKDGVPYGINRVTWEMLFFNHTWLYNRQEITNKNMNVFWGTGSGKTSFMRSQIPLRFSYWDHFIIFDPKRDYVEFTRDLKGQNISFQVNKPIGFNIFYRSSKKYVSKVIKWDTTEEVLVDVQSVEQKKQNLIKIFQIMCPFLAEKTPDSEFWLSILDSAISQAYNDDPTGETISLQRFYDIYLNNSIKYYQTIETEKINTYSQAWERLKANFSLFVKKEDWSTWQYYKMFEQVPQDQQLVLWDQPLINFDLSNVFNDDKIFTICCLIGLEFTWTQVTTKRWWDDKTLYIVIDENWKLLKYEQAAQYEEAFSRLIRWLWGWIYTMSQNLGEYMSSPSGLQVLDQAWVNVVLKLEGNQLERLKTHFPKWFTEEVNNDFDLINASNKSFGQWYIYMKSRLIPLKYLYLPSTSNEDSYQESKAWRANLDSETWVI